MFLAIDLQIIKNEICYDFIKKMKNKCNFDKLTKKLIKK